VIAAARQAARRGETVKVETQRDLSIPFFQVAAEAQ
jgi:hypothetical protein